LEASAAKWFWESLGISVLPRGWVEISKDEGFDPTGLAGDGRNAGFDAEMLAEKALYVSRFHETFVRRHCLGNGLVVHRRQRKLMSWLCLLKRQTVTCLISTIRTWSSCRRT
jgi:hypothetical protein